MCDYIYYYHYQYYSSQWVKWFIRSFTSFTAWNCIETESPKVWVVYMLQSILFYSPSSFGYFNFVCGSFFFSSLNALTSCHYLSFAIINVSIWEREWACVGLFMSSQWAYRPKEGSSQITTNFKSLIKRGIHTHTPEPNRLNNVQCTTHHTLQTTSDNGNEKKIIVTFELYEINLLFN